MCKRSTCRNERISDSVGKEWVTEICSPLVLVGTFTTFLGDDGEEIALGNLVLDTCSIPI